MFILADGASVGLSYDTSSSNDVIYLVPDLEFDIAKSENIPGVPYLESMIMHDSGTTRFESHETYDSMCIMVPDLHDFDKPLSRILIYLASGRQTIVYQPLDAVDTLLSHVQQAEFMSMDVPILLLSILMRRDVSFLENFEEDITNLEDIIAAENAKNIPEQISKRRRHLLKLKKYYDSLFDLLQEMEENSNGLLSEKQLKSLHLQTSKADRLSHTIQNLRDYITQVRESYQAQLDIQLNSVMKFFTVITTIFLPLTLIVGWYGMNLQMPEAGYAWTYPAVIVLSAAIVAASIAYFRYKKWF